MVVRGGPNLSNAPGRLVHGVLPEAESVELVPEAPSTATRDRYVDRRQLCLDLLQDASAEAHTPVVTTGGTKFLTIQTV